MPLKTFSPSSSDPDAAPPPSKSQNIAAAARSDPVAAQIVSSSSPAASSSSPQADGALTHVYILVRVSRSPYTGDDFQIVKAYTSLQTANEGAKKAFEEIFGDEYDTYKETYSKQDGTVKLVGGEGGGEGLWLYVSKVRFDRGEG